MQVQKNEGAQAHCVIHLYLLDHPPVNVRRYWFGEAERVRPAIFVVDETDDNLRREEEGGGRERRVSGDTGKGLLTHTHTHTPLGIWTCG